MLSRAVLAQEFYLKKESCMRIFARMDISVYQRNGKFHYFVNELTSSHNTALFLEWDHGSMDYAIQDLSKALHFVAQRDRFKRLEGRWSFHP